MTFKQLCQQASLSNRVFRVRVGHWFARQPEERTPELIDKVRQARLGGLEGEKVDLMMRVLLQHAHITDEVVQKLWATGQLEFALDYISLSPEQRRWVEEQVQIELPDIYPDPNNPHKASAELDRLRHVLARLIEQGHTMSRTTQKKLLDKAQDPELDAGGKRRILQILAQDPTTPDLLLRKLVSLMEDSVVGAGRELLSHPRAQADTLISILQVFADRNGYTRSVRNGLLEGRNQPVPDKVRRYMADTAQRIETLEALLGTLTDPTADDRKLCYYILERLIQQDPEAASSWLEHFPDILQQAPSDLLASLMKEGEETIRKKVARMLKERSGAKRPTSPESTPTRPPTR